MPRAMMRSTFSTFASVGLFSLLVAACGGAPAPAPVASPAPAVAPVAAPVAGPKAALKEPGDAKVGDKTKCAVSGEEMTVEATSPKAEYQGKTYYFCCGGCQKKFEADPAKYVKKS